MPADLEAFAAGDDDALWRRPASRRLNDPRPVMLVPGVANRDARAVYEARERRLREALTAEDRDTAALELAEAAQLRLWRGHSLVSLEVFAENVLGLTPDEAEALLRRGAELAGSADAAPDEVVATWMRAESGLLEGSPDAVVRLRQGRLVLEVPLEGAAAGLAAVGWRSAPLAREQEKAPRSVVDRPKGVPRISRLERDPNADD